MQKITKKMYDKELRSLYGPLKLLSYLMSRKWGVSIVHTLFGLTKGKKIKSLNSDQVFVPSRNGGADIRVRVFRPDTEETLPRMQAFQRELTNFNLVLGRSIMICT